MEKQSANGSSGIVSCTDHRGQTERKSEEDLQVIQMRGVRTISALLCDLKYNNSVPSLIM